jgi:hypothetical protein
MPTYPNWSLPLRHENLNRPCTLYLPCPVQCLNTFRTWHDTYLSYRRKWSQLGMQWEKTSWIPHSQCKVSQLLQMIWTVTRDHIPSPASLRPPEHYREQNTKSKSIEQHMHWFVHSWTQFIKIKTNCTHSRWAPSSQLPNAAQWSVSNVAHTPLARDSMKHSNGAVADLPGRCFPDLEAMTSTRRWDTLDAFCWVSRPLSHATATATLSTENIT